MATELRCNGTLFGIISDDGTTIEVKCNRRRCGHAPGLVVLHILSLTTGQELSTRVFKDPTRKEDHGTR
ncbi:hypothetical protein SEA_HUWBERT_46 [Microbacterium phage Huwbert]|nr:hypothetical protein PBI_TRISCUIT_45 [Microbacterium phage Triscuit]WNO27869.1 hypothetical protein SEA_HUWBERT_46 [Microbacterium phage Huwbert]